jgi:serine/threonine protein kinase/Tol biopolymer transport system component
MGAIYRAEDTILNISVAVKENLFLSEEYARQFEREAKILAGMRHPGLPKVGDYFTIPGQGQYIIMDYIEGEDLRERIERMGILPVSEVVRIGVAMCEALIYLHGRQPNPILHRDIKPGNIRISNEGGVVLVDFGLAKIMRGNQVTTDGARAMTPGYSPPEQYGTARTDPRTDIYSLGATLYAAITGIIPEDGLDRATGKAVLTPLREIRPNIDRRLAAVIEKSLATDSENRYQSAEEFKKALVAASDISRSIYDELKIDAPPVTDQTEDSAEGVETADEPSHVLTFSNSHPYNGKRNKRRRMVTFTFVIVFALVLMTTTYFVFTGFPPSIIAAFSPSTSTVSEFSPSTSMVSASSTSLPFATDTMVEILAANNEPSATPSSSEIQLPTQKPTPTILPSNTPIPTPAATPIGGRPGQIAFASDRTGVMQLWLMNPDGSKQQQLTNLPDGACQPAWSPDGQKLAFISPCSGKKNETYEGAHIFIMDIDELIPQPLIISSVEGDFDPAWSPDGTRLAFTSLRVGKAHVFSYNLESEVLQELSDTRFADFQPAWSPDGTQLAVVRKNVFSHIYLLSEKGFTQYQFSSIGDLDDYWPNWSPDGDLIIFSRTTISPAIPFLVGLNVDDRTSGKETRIPPLGSPDRGPIAGANFSADGNWIVYEGWPDGRNHDIFLMDIEGENSLRLTTDPGFDFNPAWRPSAQP